MMAVEVGGRTRADLYHRNRHIRSARDSQDWSLVSAQCRRQRCRRGAAAVGLSYDLRKRVRQWAIFLKHCGAFARKMRIESITSSQIIKTRKQGIHGNNIQPKHDRGAQPFLCGASSLHVNAHRRAGVAPTCSFACVRTNFFLVPAYLATAARLMAEKPTRDRSMVERLPAQRQVVVTVSAYYFVCGAVIVDPCARR